VTTAGPKANGSLTVAAASTASTAGSVSTPGGPGYLTWWVMSGTLSGATIKFEAQDSGNNWQVIAAQDDVSGAGYLNAPWIPDAQGIRITVTNPGASSVTVGYNASVPGSTASFQLDNLEQQTTDGCYASAGWWSTQHSDESAVKAAVTALAPNGTTLGDIKAAVNSLTNGATLNTLDGDLGQLHADELAVEAELSNGGTGGGSTATVQPVSFDSTAAAQLDGEGQALHGDVYLLAGVIVGCFVMTEVLRRLFP
jgi:hypothetical protein